MTDIEALKTLLERIEAGDRPAFLDGLADAAFPPRFDNLEFVYVVEAYDNSLDAAESVHNAVIPGWGWGVENDEATVWHPERYGSIIHIHRAGKPARAWLIAIIKAKIAELEE